MTLSFEPLTNHVGAKVRGLDLAAPYPPATTEALHQAFAKHKLLLVRQPGVSDDDQIRFAELSHKFA